jgi:YidC/Oxa1 family membrane protein insertase
MKQFFTTILYIPLYNLLIFLVWATPGHSLGVAIIALTILLRFALLPASLKAARAQARLQLLQPEMNRIKKEIKDQKAQGAALMELYKKEGVSPFGSCLPLLIQLPILIVLYQVFRSGVDTSNFNLLYSFVPRPESISAHFLSFDLSKPDLWILPILAGASQFILSKMMMTPTPKNNKPGEMDTMAMANKQMVYLFPIITVVFARSMPAALSLYWIITTVFGIVQQIYVNKSIRENPKEIKEAREDVKEIEEEYAGEIDNNVAEKAVKPDMMTKLMNRRLEKQEKKTGVEITIRKKK